MSDQPSTGASRWTDDPSVPRGARYDARFEALAARGVDVHGEADLLSSLVPDGALLDAGCGTGRVAIELARRGREVVGTDLDPAMLEAARAKAPDLDWHQADLVDLALRRRFRAVVLAGNVLIFVTPGAEARAVARCAAHLEPGGLLVAGFQVRPDGYGPEQLDLDAADAGLGLVHRWSTWAREPWEPGGDYQVSVHRSGDG